MKIPIFGKLDGTDLVFEYLQDIAKDDKIQKINLQKSNTEDDGKEIK